MAKHLNELTLPARVGIVGCGNISNRYVQNASLFKQEFCLTCCTDLLDDCTQQLATRGKMTACGSLDELLARNDVDIVLNLTTPPAHAAVSIAALAAGKHIYSEKPLGITLNEAGQILKVADQNNCFVGCAPDTFLGASGQEARALIDAGAIGQIIAGSAFMLTGGPETWHPNPESFYQPGSGPLWDMGPYYISALVSLLGPVKQVMGSARMGNNRRRIGSGPKQGQEFETNTSSHIAGVLTFHSGAIITLVTSFDVPSSTVPFMELYGTEGTLQLPDPNTFSGSILVKMHGARRWKKIGHRRRPWKKDSRGLGLADLARSVARGELPRCSGAFAYHGTEIMEAVLASAESGQVVEIRSRLERPLPLE